MSDYTNGFQYVIVDLFCGGGGFSHGLVNAIIDKERAEIADATRLDPEDVDHEHPRVQWWLAWNVKLVGINHDDDACDTWKANHPYGKVINSKVQATHPPSVVDNERVDILIAGPSCVPFSQAKGGKPANDDQLRMSPQHVAHYLRLLRPPEFILENVPGFKKNGRLVDHDKPDGPRMIRDGSVFESWLDDLRSYGYSVDHRTLYADDFGDPQARKRLFIRGSLEYAPSFPEPTHSNEDDTKPDKRTAADIIDLEDTGESVFTRDLTDGRRTPLAKSTMARIAEGIRRHAPDRLQPFADTIERIHSEDTPVETLRTDRLVPAEQAHLAAKALDEPFLVALPNADKAESTTDYIFGQHSNSISRDITERPVPTIATRGNIHKLTANGYVLKYYNNGHSHALDEPLHTVTAQGQNLGLISPAPFLLRQHGGEGTIPPNIFDDSYPTIATKGAISFVTPTCHQLIKPRNGLQRGTHSNPLYPPTGRALHTVTAKNHDGHLISVLESFLTPRYSERPGQRPRTRSLSRPIMTIPAQKVGGPANLITPLLIDTLAENPVATTSLDGIDEDDPERVALCIPDMFPLAIDIKFRMLNERELARGQGFPDTYEFTPNTKDDTTKLIGNAVPANLAKALCSAVLTRNGTPSLNHFGETPQPAAEELTSDD